MNAEQRECALCSAVVPRMQSDAMAWVDRTMSRVLGRRLSRSLAGIAVIGLTGRAVGAAVEAVATRLYAVSGHVHYRRRERTRRRAPRSAWRRAIATR